MGEIICEGDIGWQVGAGVERAGALAAVQLGHEGVLVNPVGAGEWAGQAGSDAVAGAVDTVLVVEVDFGNDSGHVNALVVADAAGLVVGDLEVGEFVGVDLAFADGTVTGEVLVICFLVRIRIVDGLTIGCLSP